MKRASYRDGVDFIAMNDEPDELDPDRVQPLCTVQLLAAVFGVSTERVARDVVRLRVKEADAAKAKLERAFGVICAVADR